MIGNQRPEGEILSYLDSTAVEAVLVWEDGGRDLWVLPQGGHQAYGYPGFSSLDWFVAMSNSGQSPGRAWVFTKNRFESIHGTREPETCSRAEFFAMTRQSFSDIKVSINFNSLFDF